jgi:hypothetical protein
MLKNMDPKNNTGFVYRWFLMLPTDTGELCIYSTSPLNKEWQEIQGKMQEVISTA